MYGTFYLDKISNIHGHLRNFSLVELFNITKVTDISLSQEVDGHTLTSETTRTSNTMDVVLTIGGKIKVDHERHLLDIDTTGKQIGRDEYTRGTRTELAHDNITLALVHVAVHARDSEITLLHLFLQPVNLAAGVAVDDGLSDGQSLVQIAKGVELPLFTLNSNVELLDTLKGQLILLDKNTDGIAHETLGDFKHIKWHGRREKAHLHSFGKELEDVIDLILKSPGEHLISLIQEELTNGIQPQGTTVDHIVNTTGGSHNNVDTCLEGTNIITDGGTSNTGMNLKVHVVTEGNHDLLNLLGQLTGGGKNQRLALA
mmetsp:Transcript_14375/g.31152  ORF Transcript_14375/g.31152 Transcript_14375/m.31152 type:complete len:315 (+) Transcript_14375:57-1001(+)